MFKNLFEGRKEMLLLVVVIIGYITYLMFGGIGKPQTMVLDNNTHITADQYIEESSQELKTWANTTAENLIKYYYEETELSE